MADQEAIRQRVYSLGTQATQLDNGVRGLADEVGELNGAAKRWLEYGKELDTTNILEEAGDCLWRLSQILDACGLTLDQAMEANLRKLKIRYDGGYSDAKAAEEARDLGAERLALLPGTNVLSNVEQDGHGFGHQVDFRAEDLPLPIVRPNVQLGSLPPKFFLCPSCSHPMNKKKVEESRASGSMIKCPNCLKEIQL